MNPGILGKTAGPRPARPSIEVVAAAGRHNGTGEAVRNCDHIAKDPTVCHSWQSVHEVPDLTEARNVRSLRSEVRLQERHTARDEQIVGIEAEEEIVTGVAHCGIAGHRHAAVSLVAHQPDVGMPAGQALQDVPSAVLGAVLNHYDLIPRAQVAVEDGGHRGLYRLGTAVAAQEETDRVSALRHPKPPVRASRWSTRV